MSSSVDLASFVAQAREALATRRMDSAIEAAGRALKVEPRCVDAYLVRAEAFRRTGKYERALADLAVAVRLAPERPGPYIVRAEILKRRNVFDRAIADATHALILDPRNASAFSIRAQCRHAVGDREGATDDVRAMLDLDPTRAVPDLPAAIASPSHPAAILDERFWKEPGDGCRPDDPSLFADGKLVDRTYRTRRGVADEDAPEELGAASGYRPEVAATLPRIKPMRRRPPSRNGGLATLALGVLLGAAGVFWGFHRTSGPIGARATSAPPPGASTDTEVDARPTGGTTSESSPPGPADETLSPLEGIWLASSEVAGGERTGEEEMRPRRKTLKVAGDTFELSESRYKLIGRIKPAPDDGADAVDLDGRYVAGGDGRGLKLRGVFKVDGDDLVLCYSYSYDDGVQVDRPKTFEALTGRNPICVDFKRVGATGRSGTPPPDESSPIVDAGAATYLTDLPRITLAAHNGWWSDRGETALGGLDGRPMIRKTLMFLGSPSTHGVYLHARPSGEAAVAYRLAGRFHGFRSEVVVPEMLPEQGDPRTPLVFEVRGDGRTLWRSSPLSRKGDHQSCSVSVEGVDELSLAVVCRGPENWGLAAWIEPRLDERRAGDEELTLRPAKATSKTIAP